MNKKIIVSLLQLDLIWENPGQNLNKIERYIAGNKKSDIIVLPELFSTGFTMNVKEFGETMNGETLNFLREISEKYKTAICGSLLIKENYNYYNRFVFIKPGQEIEYYDKRHLFSVGGENESYSEGKTKRIIEFMGFKILPLICYDLRFPVWSRNKEDYDILIYVANWPASRRKHWDILLKARAIENQAVVLATNRIGTDGRNINYDGGTIIINAFGQEIFKTDDNKEQIITAEILKQDINKLRKDFPVWKDKDDFIIK